MATFNALVSAALTAATAYAKSIEGLRPLCAGLDRAAVKAKLLDPVAKFYAVPVVVSESNNNKGQRVLDKSAAKYAAAARALDRLTNDIAGSASAQKAELDVPAHIAKLAAQLAAACNEYEQSRKLASTAIAAAFTKQ